MNETTTGHRAVPPPGDRLVVDRNLDAGRGGQVIEPFEPEAHTPIDTVGAEAPTVAVEVTMTAIVIMATVVEAGREATVEVAGGGAVEIGEARIAGGGHSNWNSGLLRAIRHWSCTTPSSPMPSGLAAPFRAAIVSSLIT